MSATTRSEELAPDLNDVDYDAFLASDRTLDEVVAVERAGRVRLRIINRATTSAFHIDLGKLECGFRRSRPGIPR